MARNAVLMSRSAMTSSHHVRELLNKLTKSHIKIYTDKKSLLVQMECLACDILPTITGSIPCNDDDVIMYFIDVNPESMFKKFIDNCEVRGIKYELISLL